MLHGATVSPYSEDPNMFTFCVIEKQPPEVFYKKRCSYKFRKIHRKTPVPEPLF